MWKEAMLKEMDTLYKNDNWELLESPQGRRLLLQVSVWYEAKISTRSYYMLQGQVGRKRLHTERRYGLYEVFSPIVKHSSIQILLALVAQYDLEPNQLDVKIVFLHGDLDEQIFMIHPMGFKTAVKENLVCKLKKSTYELEQSLRQWYK